MEMILCLLFLGLTCAITLRLFAWAYVMRAEARANNHIQEMTITASEILECWDGSAESFLKALNKAGYEVESGALWKEQEILTEEKGSLPENVEAEYVFTAAYDRYWLPCSFEEGVYLMQGECRRDRYENTLDLVFARRNPGSGEAERIRSFSVSFPVRQEELP